MNIVIMGVQGSGKGTQSKMLSERVGIPHISVGDLLRAHIAEGTALGAQAKAFIDKGELVPDSLVIDMVDERLEQDDALSGFILDGFPRNDVQLAAMTRLKPIDHVVLIELDDETAIRRLAHRSECRQCGIIYGANRRPKQDGVCDECGEPLAERSDDQAAEAVRRRMALYHQETAVIADHYERKGLLRRVDGSGGAAEVFEEVLSAIGHPPA